MKLLFIAEKPDVSKKVSAVYKNNKADIISKVGEIDFIALSGHVCRLLEPDEYPSWKGLKWADTPLPMIPDPFLVTVAKPEVVKRVKEALNKTKYDGIIVATDSDVEGNGIYYLLCEHLKLKKYPTYRFFEQSMTEKEILNSLYSMTDYYTNLRDVRMTEAYLIRSRRDWIVGMNGTRAATVKTGELERIGTVKSNTMKHIYDNQIEIENFVPHSDFEAKVYYLEGFTGLYSDKDGPILFKTKEEAENFIKGLSAPTAQITRYDVKRVETPAPQLFKLSSAQVEAGAQYNYNPKKTLEIIQSLYEKGFISYPRTDGIYVSSEKAKEFNDLIDVVKGVPALNAYASAVTQADIDNVKTNKRVVNDVEAKKASHDALLPTYMKPNLSSLSTEEQNIYDMICRRFLAQFMPKLLEDKTVLFTAIDGYAFKSTGSTVVSKGWSELYNRQNKAEQIPPHAVLDILDIGSLDVAEKKATPPKRLTTSTLIDDMENWAKFITDKTLKKVMKDAKGIGMPSTRSKIIEDLITTGYITISGKNEAITISNSGRRYVELIKDFSIVDYAQAAKWETVVQSVKEGSMTYKEAEAVTIDFINSFITEMGNLNITPVRKGGVSTTPIGVKCPYCGKDIYASKYDYRCEDYDKGCTFLVRTNDGKLTENDLKTLVTKGSTRKIKNICYSKANNKSYDAKVVLAPKGSQYSTKFEFK